ncbi:MAG TPA: acyl-CoA dehydrogenase [Alphaproteobacteria bacterium]|nr:acyl-CoA dehydrogenase [Alphaproteobacteria bacterium]HAJ48533.1 acyl-CoA dehydrogenase [Alphaproteobacteria bacterium]
MRSFQLPFTFDVSPAPQGLNQLRHEVRSFLARELPGKDAVLRAQGWSGFDPEFSRRLGARGWIGMAWPKQYGGHARTALERYTIIEELLAGEAPVSAHWVADRQSGPLLIRYGNTRQQQILPQIARGEVYFAIGMSEPDAGSDLAAVRTRAVREADGWRVTGRKIWSSLAHKAHYMIALFRTGESANERNAGLSQFLVDMATPGIEVRPIPDLTGDVHFNEVTFDGALLPLDALIGAEGQGWAQVTAELAFERSGPERFLSAMALFKEIVRLAGPEPGERAAHAIGRLSAHLMTLRQMSLSVAAMLERGANPALEASIVKDLGAVFEQEIPEIANGLFGRELDPLSADTGARVQAYMTQISPAFSLRGGTREILRGIIARGLGLR